MAGSAQNLQTGIANLSLENGNASSNVSIQVVDKSKTTHHTYTVGFYKGKIHTTVTHTASIVDQWISETSRHYRNKVDVVVGLGVEWCRLRGTCTRNKVAVLQICISRRCLIFQFSHCDDIPKSLFEFLENKKFIFVGVGVDGHVGKLLVDHGLKVARCQDLGSLADYKLAKTIEDYRSSEFYKAEMQTLAKAVLSQDLPRPRDVELSNWDLQLLSNDQVEYACLGALVSFKLGIHFLGEHSPVTTTDGSEQVMKQTKETGRLYRAPKNTTHVSQKDEQ